jgi:hypothetical protein
MAIDLDKYLNYVVPKPTYLGQLEQAGLISAQDLEDAKKQSMVQGLLGAGLSYLAQPKTGGYGSAIPYLAKSAMVGLESSGAPYKRLAENAMTGAKIQDIAYERGKRESVQESVEDFVAKHPEFEDIKGLTVEQQGGIISDYYKQRYNRLYGPDRYQKQYLIRDNETNETYNAVYDKFDGKTYINTPTGKVPYNDFVKDKNTSIFTAGGAQKGMMSPAGFKKTRDEIIQDEIGLDNLVKYMKDVEDLPSGYNKLANQFTEWWKTFTDSNKDQYTEEELAQRVAEGRFQGLIGLVRVETVGGGVMTEFDAQRIMQRLGGDPRSISTNPEVMKAQIQDVLRNKYRRYQDNLEAYNTEVDTGYTGYRKRNPITFNDNDLKFLDPEFLKEVPLSSTQSNLPKFNSPEQVEQAYNAGQLKDGDTVIINGQEFTIGE